MTTGPPDGWTVWNEEPGRRLVLAFRPDVFDGTAFPAPCLPTIAVAPGRGPNQRPEQRARSGAWYRACYLEPDVRLREADEVYDAWEAAVEGAHRLAEAFLAGEVDYHAAYAEPRDDYLAKLDELVGDAD